MPIPIVKLTEMVTVEDAIEHFFAGLKARLENRTQHAFVAFINTSTRKPPHTLVQTHAHTRADMLEHAYAKHR